MENEKSPFILVVEDSEFDKNLVKKILIKKGNYNVDTASSASECLEKIQANEYDLVLLDIMLPDSNGIEVLKSIRKDQNQLNLPIIMVTSKSDSSDMIDCLKNGANDFIGKPLNFEVAMMRITTQLKISELSKSMIKLNEMVALTAMVTTYNHEINNPLAVALAGIRQIRKDPLSNLSSSIKVEESLERISRIVKKISELMDVGKIEYDAYGKFNNRIKID
jgi:DNA-binding response OmpR family regulator